MGTPKLDIEAWKSEYREAARGINSGIWRRNHLCAWKLARLKAQASIADAEVRKAYEELLTDPDPAVRMAAAGEPLMWSEQPGRCLGVLRECAQVGGAVGAASAMAVWVREQGLFKPSPPEPVPPEPPATTRPVYVPGDGTGVPRGEAEQLLDALLVRLRSGEHIPHDEVAIASEQDERMGAVGDLVGICEDGVQLAPNHRKPSEDLAVAWVIRPDLVQAVWPRAPEWLRLAVVRHYQV